MLFFLLSILFNLPMPLVAIQLLWLNIVTDGLQDFALSFEGVEDDVMNKPPIKQMILYLIKNCLVRYLYQDCL